MESKLFQYIKNNDRIKFQLELDNRYKNKDINRIRQDHKPYLTLLEYAIMYRKYEMIKVLIKNNINLNYISNKENDTPLIFALKLRKPIVANFLIENGADVNVVNKQNESPLSIATKEKLRYDELVKLMIFLINNEDSFKEVISKKNNINQVREFINIQFYFRKQFNKVINTFEETERGNIPEDKFIVAILGLYYLIKKNKNACVPRNMKKVALFKQITNERELPLMKWQCYKGKRVLSTFNNEKFMNRYNWCLNNKNIRFIVTSLGLYDRYDCSVKDKEQGHANILIHDKKKQTIERFEPNGVVEGNNWFEQDKLDTELKSFFMVENNFNIKEYLYPINICPKEGFQAIQSDEDISNSDYLDGYCIIWSHFYLYLRLEFPDIDQMALIESSIIALKENQRSFTNFISDYTNAIVQISKDIEEE